MHCNLLSVSSKPLVCGGLMLHTGEERLDHRCAEAQVSSSGTRTCTCAHTHHSPSHPSYLQIFLSLETTLLSSDSLSDEALLYLNKYSVRVWILGDNFSSRGHVFIAARCGGELSGLGTRGLTFSPCFAMNRLCDLRQLFNQSGPQFPHLFREGWSWTA